MCMATEALLEIKKLLLCEYVTAPAGDPSDGDPGVVIADAAGDAVEEPEGAGVSLLEGFGALTWESAAEEDVAKGERQDEDSDLGQLPADPRQGVSEVGLRLAGSVLQGDEDLGPTPPPGTDGVTDDAASAGVAELVAVALEEARGRMRCFGGAARSSSRMRWRIGRNGPSLGLGLGTAGW